MIIMEANASHVQRWVPMANFVVVMEDVKEVELEKEMVIANVTPDFLAKLVINVP